MEILPGTSFKMQSYLVWKDVELELSYERQAAAKEIAVLTIRRLRSRIDRVVVYQIPLDVQSRLMPLSESDRRRFRFGVQHGKKCARFQAPDEFTFVTWCEAISRCTANAGKPGAVARAPMNPGQNGHEVRRAAAKDVGVVKLQALKTDPIVQPSVKTHVLVDDTYYMDETLALGGLVDASEHECECKSDSDISTDSCEDKTEFMIFDHLVDAAEHADLEYEEPTEPMLFDHLVDAVEHVDEEIERNAIYQTVAVSDALDVMEDGESSYQAPVSAAAVAVDGDLLALGGVVDETNDDEEKADYSKVDSNAETTKHLPASTSMSAELQVFDSLIDESDCQGDSGADYEEKEDCDHVDSKDTPDLHFSAGEDTFTPNPTLDESHHATYEPSSIFEVSTSHHDTSYSYHDSGDTNSSADCFSSD